MVVRCPLSWARMGLEFVWGGVELLRLGLMYWRWRWKV